ncbi:phosphoserine phosphatase [Physcia stellaris]|nr:phosphoserine phosphatase [Physcia stellaris]
MNGEIDFATSLHERVGLLKGVRADVWESLRTDGSITIARGARELVSGLKAMGVVTAVVSGGFTPMAEWLQAQLGLDYAFANHLLTAPPEDGLPFEHLSGRLDPAKPLVDGQQKKDILLRLAAEHAVPIEQTIAVGDGSNDLLMMHAAGMGIAFRAKEKVQREAPRRLNGESLEEVLYLFGGGEFEVHESSKP